MKTLLKTLLVFAFILPVKSIGQEIDFDKLARLVFSEYNGIDIQKLKDIADSSFYEEQKMIKLLSYDQTIKNKIKENNDYVTSVNNKVSSNNKRLSEIERKIDKLKSEAKDLLRTKNRHKKEADRYYLYHEIAARNNDAVNRNRNYASYKKSMTLYRKYIDKCNFFASYAEKKEKQYRREHNNLRNTSINLVNTTNSNARNNQKVIDGYKIKKRNLSKEIYNYYLNFKGNTKKNKVVTSNDLKSWVKKGRDYKKKGNDLEAIKWLTKAANKGDVEGQVSLADVYYFGDYQNNEKAFKWYLKAANQGHPVAQNNVAGYYKYGERRDLKKVLMWYLKSAKQGESSAQINLGNIYKEGEGVTKDLTEALKWYKKACDNGSSTGCNMYKKYKQ